MISTEVLANDVLLNITGGSLGRCAIVPSNFERGNVSQHVCILRPVQVLSAYLHYFCISNFFTQTMTLSGSGREGLPKYSLEQMQIPIPPLQEQNRIVEEIERWNVLIDGIDEDKQELLDFLQLAKSKVLSLAISGKLVPQDPNEEPAIELLKRINPHFIPCDTSHYENLPASWCISSLKDAGIEILNGYAFQSKNYVPNGIKVIRITNVQDGYIVDDDPKYYPIFSKEEIGRYLLHENDLLMSLTGNVGRVGFLQKEMLPAALNQRVGCIRGTEQVITKKYLYYFLQSDLFKTNCIDSAKGVAQLNISTEWLIAYVMPIPPIEEQIRISTKIEQIFTAIDTITAEL